jgi:predicted nuclease with TOPRIM domain
MDDEIRQRLTDRLAVLHREQEIGADRLRRLDQEHLALQQTLLRIAGAAQVLRELLDEETAEVPQGVP